MAEAYAEAHPDQYEWVAGYLTNFSFMWDGEVEGLKDCDYVFVPTPMNQFVKQYRQVGNPEAKFLGGDPQVAFLGMLDDARLWDEVDGMLVIRSYRWWNEDGPIVNLTKDLLARNHPDKADEIRSMGVSYLSVMPAYVILQLVRETVESVGPEGFDSEALYNEAQSFSIDVDGSHHSFSRTKRASTDAFGIYELSAARRDLVRADPEWLPIVLQP